MNRHVGFVILECDHHNFAGVYIYICIYIYALGLYKDNGNYSVNRFSTMPVQIQGRPVHPVSPQETVRVLGVWMSGSQGTDAHRPIAVGRAWGSFASFRRVFTCQKASIEAGAQCQSGISSAMDCIHLETQQTSSCDSMRNTSYNAGHNAERTMMYHVCTTSPGLSFTGYACVLRGISCLKQKWTHKVRSSPGT